jgi:hypothetical protein
MAGQDQDLRVASEPDALTRAQACLRYVGDLAGELDNLSKDERALARVDGRQTWVAGQQRVHTQLATASALIAIAEELRGIRDLLGKKDLQ